MLVLLPPSETKRRGGNGPPLDHAALSFPSLTEVRRGLVRALVTGKAPGCPAVHGGEEWCSALGQCLFE